MANIKFEFSAPPNASSFNNGYQGYSEIIVQGNDTVAPPPPSSPYLVEETLPTYAETVVGDQVVITAAFSNSPPASLQWQVVKNGVTNDVSGATTSTLTLNNVQVADSGTYLLKAVNATNGAAAPSYSLGCPLVVGSLPAAVGNVVVRYASQNFPSSASGYFPAWPVTTNSLIYGSVFGSGPGTFTSVGDFTGGGNFLQR